MKIISLNIWGGRVKKDFINFIESNKDVDIFCFQEVYKDAVEAMRQTPYLNIAEHESFRLLEKLLPDHKLIFHPSFLDVYGQCMAIKKSFAILETGEVFIHKEKGFIPDGDLGKHARNLQYATIKQSDNSESITVINVHGLWNGEGKTDSKDRIEQSQKIVDFIKTIPEPVVMCGDFNLNIDTTSIEMIEKIGLRNLIKEYQIPSTRTSLYNKSEKYADYIFISSDIKEKQFTVMPDEVSDHSPLLVEI